MDVDREVLLKDLIDVVHKISTFPAFRCVLKKQCWDLSRRLKLLMPLFEELMEIREHISEETVSALVLLKEAMESAKELLEFCCRGSKLVLVLRLEQMKKKFLELSIHFEQALDGVRYDKLDIPDDLQEQVELVRCQFGRYKERVDAPELEQCAELLSLFNESNDEDTHPSTISMLCVNLGLMTIKDLSEESVALNEMITAIGGAKEDIIEKASLLLKKVEDFFHIENLKHCTFASENCFSNGNDQTCSSLSPKSINVPNDFRCPISLDLMKEPVIICTGQTYERTCIKEWIDAGHGTCPITQQKLCSSILTPNYALSSIITHWCEANGVELPGKSGKFHRHASLGCSVEVEIGMLLSKLASINIGDQQAAAGKLRLLAKNNGDNRLSIARAGAIPLLIDLLHTSDSLTQEHSVTALLNLSICESNKRSIIYSGAISGILHVLKNGSMEARENAAATLFSLSVLDEHKITIGALGAIPELVTLLREGSQRGKKDAATALFNLCIYQGNKGRAIRAGVVPLLMTLVTEPGGEMLDETLAIMALLAGHPEGKTAIGALEAITVFVKLMESRSLRNKENATAVLLHLCSGNQQFVGVRTLLLDLAENSSDRGRRKATQLLEIVNSFTEQQKLTELQTTAQAESQTELQQG